MDFDVLDRLLKDRGISRRKLALAVGINENKMSSAFKRRSGLSSEDVLKIAEYLGVSPYYLEGWTDGENDMRLSFDQEINIMAQDMEAFRRLDNYEAQTKKAQRKKDMLSAFDRLNSLGQLTAVQRVEELTEISRYTAQEDD